MNLENVAKFRLLGLSLVAEGSSENKDINDIIGDVTDEINSLLTDSQTTIKTSDDYLAEVYQKAMDNINGVKPDSTLTGFKDFDERGGFKPSNLDSDCS
jgi:hypothetical protein